MINFNNQKRKIGKGLINTLINKLPFELHIPGYNFCGPGTKLEKRLARGDKGINPLDEACKEHDIAYSKIKDIKSRNIADETLAVKALERLRAKDTSFGERAAALGIAGAMKIKTKLGMGIRKRHMRRKMTKGMGLRRRVDYKGRGISLTKAIAKARNAIKGKKFRSMNSSIQVALKALKGKKILNSRKRILPIPKTGGFLPLIPLFAGLSALGALGGGAAGIAKAVNDAKSANQKLAEDKRHNKTMEEIALGKTGSGLFLKPYKTGCGLYLKPYSKNC